MVKNPCKGPVRCALSIRSANRYSSSSGSDCKSSAEAFLSCNRVSFASFIPIIDWPSAETSPKLLLLWRIQTWNFQVGRVLSALLVVCNTRFSKQFHSLKVSQPDAAISCMFVVVLLSFGLASRASPQTFLFGLKWLLTRQSFSASCFPNIYILFFIIYLPSGFSRADCTFCSLAARSAACARRHIRRIAFATNCMTKQRCSLDWKRAPGKHFCSFGSQFFSQFLSNNSM